MSGAPISILLIAPYQSMADSVAEVCKDYPNISMVPFIGNLDDGVRYCQEAVSICHYDLILSRGGTTTALRQTASIPIIDIEVSAYDMLRAILAAQQFGRPFAVVGFSNITMEAHQLCETVGWDLTIYEVHNQTDAGQIIAKLSDEDPCTLIVGDVLSTNTAQSMGMSTVLITSGEESIRKALDNACDVFVSMSIDREKTQFFRTVLEEASDPLAVFDEGGQLLFTNCFANNERLLPLMDRLSNMIMPLRQSGTILTRVREGNLMVTIRGVRIGKPAPYYVFWLRPIDVSLSQTSDAIQVRESCQSLFACDSLVESNEYMLPVMQQFRMITGTAELTPGCTLFLQAPAAKIGASAALFLHTHCKEVSNCFITINCDLLTLERWQSFLSEIETAFGARAHTVYFENPERLAPQLQIAMVEAVRRLSDHYVILSSSVQNLRQLTASGQFNQELFLLLCPYTLRMAPLNERREDIPVFAHVLIQQFNKKFSRQIIGLPQDAISMLQQFDWNMDAGQFEQVIFQTLRVSVGHYVSAKDLQLFLNQSKAAFPVREDTVKLTGTLDEIEMQIIHSVVSEENMNYSKAAKRLGISRSTLWRKLTMSREEAASAERK